MGDWVAVLECGLGRHMRHKPPWEDRPWVLTAPKAASASLGWRSTAERVMQKGKTTVGHMQQWTWAKRLPACLSA